MDSDSHLLEVVDPETSGCARGHRRCFELPNSNTLLLIDASVNKKLRWEYKSCRYIWGANS